ncbi:hypothetical protein Zmor_010516 [Zophobas morio]|uniref:Uncharacterized protein n=1 Tax=Zophobas morio TaxID=2755281 RepID=A0AA38INQ7_9CUCU|nr:hypothetical protein Zmor_010516 [Zophobas morio]
MEVIKSTEYVPPPESNMNGHYSHLMSHHNQSVRSQQRPSEWETVNGRAKSRSAAAPVPAPTQAAVDARRRKQTTKPQMDSHDRLINNRSLRPTSKAKNQRPAAQRMEKVKGVVGYQSATACYVGGAMQHDSAVYGVYSETKYTFAVNGMPGTSAQASAAAAFFARFVN